MRIVEQSDSRLVLNVGSVWLYSLLGSAVGLFGLSLIFLPDLFIDLPGFVAALVGAGLVIVAAAVLALAQSASFYFDKRQGQLKITREGLMSGSIQEYALSDIRAVRMEQKPDGDKFRLVLVFEAGELPLISAYMLTQPQAENLLSSIQSFLPT